MKNTELKITDKADDKPTEYHKCEKCGATWICPEYPQKCFLPVEFECSRCVLGSKK